MLGSVIRRHRCRQWKVRAAPFCSASLMKWSLGQWDSLWSQASSDESQDQNLCVFVLLFFSLLTSNANAGIQNNIFCNCLGKKWKWWSKGEAKERIFYNRSRQGNIFSSQLCPASMGSPKGEGNFSCSLQGLQPGQLTKKHCEMDLGKESQIHQKVFMGPSLYAQCWSRCGGHGQAHSPPGEGIPLRSQPL